MKRKIVIPILVVVVGARRRRCCCGPAGCIATIPTASRCPGNIELTQVDISFKVPGKLVERTVDEGDFVKKGS